MCLICVWLLPMSFSSEINIFLASASGFLDANLIQKVVCFDGFVGKELPVKFKFGCFLGER